jgi:hypothetical protein
VVRRGGERLYIFISNLFDELAAGLNRNAAQNYPPDYRRAFLSNWLTAVAQAFVSASCYVCFGSLADINKPLKELSW